MRRYYANLHINKIKAAERMIEFGYNGKVVAAEMGLRYQHMRAAIHYMRQARERDERKAQ